MKESEILLDSKDGVENATNLSLDKESIIWYLLVYIILSIT